MTLLSGVDNTLYPVTYPGLEMYWIGWRWTPVVGQTLQDARLVADGETGAVLGVVGPEQRMKRIRGERDNAEPCRQLLPVEFAHVEATVANPGLFDVLVGHGIPGLYFRKCQRQLPIP